MLLFCSLFFKGVLHCDVAARNMLISVPDGSGGTLKLAGNPLKMSAFADPKTRRAAPDLDQRDAVQGRVDLQRWWDAVPILKRVDPGAVLRRQVRPVPLRCN